jgi:hypothetical protein
MNKIIIIFLIIGALIGLYILSKRPTPVVMTPSENETENGGPVISRPNPANATFDFDGESITLSGGKKIREIGPEGSLTEEIALTDAIAYGDINKDGKDDAVALVTRLGGGSGLFIYVVGYVSGPTAYRGTNAVFLGDRLTPQTITINTEGVITVEYLDRDSNEPFAAEPTIQTTKKFVFRNGNLEER